jgi:hypothetical protein
LDKLTDPRVNLGKQQPPAGILRIWFSDARHRIKIQDHDHLGSFLEENTTLKNGIFSKEQIVNNWSFAYNRTEANLIERFMIIAIFLHKIEALNGSAYQFI